MQAIAKSERVIYQCTGFHAALRLSYRSLGDMERSVSTRHDRFDLVSLFALQKCAVGQIRGSQIISILKIDLLEANIYRFPAEIPIFRSISCYGKHRLYPKTPVKCATRVKYAAKISIPFLGDNMDKIAISFPRYFSI
jgi:hypothetical protein